MSFGDYSDFLGSVPIPIPPPGAQSSSPALWSKNPNPPSGVPTPFLPTLLPSTTVPKYGGNMLQFWMR